MIESMSNGQIKKIQKCKKSARFRREAKCFLIEGFKMVEEALRYDRVQTMYVSEGAADEYEKRFHHKMNRGHVEWVRDAVFREISDTSTPQGVLAIASMPEYQRETLVENESAAFICLEDLQDPGNLGTIIRTAEGAGMTAVVLSKGCVDLFNPKVVRATMGAVFRMPFYRAAEPFREEIRQLRETGFAVYAACLGAERLYTDCRYDGRVGILIGNEANGLTEETASLADVSVRIPMEGEVESLNAAVSAALLMYEVHRRRG